MIDNSDTEIVAINKAYNVDPVNDEESRPCLSNVRILICHWHIVKAWIKNILKKVVAAPSNPKKTTHEEALSLMLTMMRAETPGDFDIAFEKFELWCIDNDDEWDTQSLLEYFEREYIPKKTNWSNAWRHGNYNVNTNNYVESWHRQLKEGYMSGLRRQRNILWDMVLPDVMQDYLRIKANFSPRRLNKAERQRLQRARALSEEEAEAKILGQDDNIIKVASFTDDNITYDVTIDISDNCVLACTCDDQQNSNSPCKHMFLVNRVLGIGLVRIQGQPSEPVAATDIEVQNNNEHTTESSLTIRNDAYNRFADTFSQLQIEVGKTNEQQRVPPRIINNLATSFISHIQKLKSWNSNPQGPTDHQQRY
ncbi:hypothetical protein BX666DRAFT_2034024 [Dichotomocladium elegans]|nr:hypothetical protein BX666DRAFT_2034024 [Dichotomocladium elegans]